LLLPILPLFLLGCVAEDSQYIRRDIDNLQGQIDSLREEMGSTSGTAQGDVLPEDRKRQADMEVELQKLKRDLDSLMATVQDNQELTTRTFRRLEDLEISLTTRLNDFEARLETAKGPPEPVSPPSGVETPPPVEVKKLAPADVQAGEVPSELERAYRQGYEAFQTGDLESAKKKFLAFLKDHPDTPLSDNAQFWIGEIYFKQHQYEAAILAYEDVIKNYPNSNKLPDTLLKQGLAFLELGDKIDARIILENLIKKYPNTEQAKIAKNKLKTVK
jgi:tol-pal system protein YbgF